MQDETLPSIGIIFAQFAAYHVDRCEAAAARLAGRYRVLAVEIATRSKVYAWEPAGDVAGAQKVVLFPSAGVEQVHWFRRFRAEFRKLRKCEVVFVGLPYSEPDAIALSWLLRFCGTKVVAMTESKFDDTPRSVWREAGKSLLLKAYHAFVVGGRRQEAYVRFLGSGRRPATRGYDTVSVARVVAQARRSPTPVSWDERPFLYVGRFVAKKNLHGLLHGYAAYVALAGNRPRRLRLVGDGELRRQLEELVTQLGIAHWVDWPGFLGAEAVATEMAGALALCLVSTEEQWGLVVNEAVALGLPVLASQCVGACDILVRNALNGYVVDPEDTEQIAQAMLKLSADRPQWEDMSARSRDRAALGDVEYFAAAVDSTCSRLIKGG